jgi:hypothetical protein
LPDGVPKPGKFRLPEASTAEAETTSAEMAQPAEQGSA